HSRLTSLRLFSRASRSLFSLARSSLAPLMPSSVTTRPVYSARLSASWPFSSSKLKSIVLGKV
ncbi:hypothetical protein NOIMNB_NOIMNB_08310, partial [Dysosmobacter welbionis]